MVPFSYNLVDMGGIDLALANRTVVPGVYDKIAEAMNLCGDVILYNWKFADINIVPSAYTILQQESSILINGLIQVTESDEISITGVSPEPPEPPVSSVVLSGVQAPTSDLGEDERLYVQYYEAVDANFEYGITAVFRKVSGEWVPYTEPEDRYLAVHVWTKSTGGGDAAMYVQYGRFVDGVFTPSGDVESVLYTAVSGAANAKDCKIVNLYYGAPWTLVAKQSVVLNDTSYTEGQTVATWLYSTSVDYIITKGE